MPQGRKLDDESSKSVDKGGTEASRAHTALEICIRGCQKPNIDLDRTLRPNRLDVPRFEGSQQHRLNLHRRFADLIEKERAASGFSEVSIAVLACPTKGTLRRTKELGACERRRHGSHIEREEWCLATTTLALNSSCDELLPGTRLAGDQDRDIERRNAADFAAYMLHDSTVSHQSQIVRDRALRLSPVKKHENTIGQRDHNPMLQTISREPDDIDDRFPVNANGRSHGGGVD